MPHPSDAPPHKNDLTQARCLLLLRPGAPEAAEALAEGFFGQVVRSPDALPADLSGRRVYACGDLSGLGPQAASLLAVEGLSTGAVGRVVSPGQVPRSVHGVGALFPRLFGPEDLFTRISSEHAFQNLTESTKPSLALRTGIYLSEVQEAEPEGALRFHLMRCSSNLTGPTDNFRAGDRLVLGALREVASALFERPPPLNHVLAQIYGSARTPAGKLRRAKIGAHSDKTKDMHPDAAMVFCTFYEEQALARLQPLPGAPGDLGRGRQSGLARLVFKRKRGVQDQGLAPEFSVTLAPNSALFIPLSTNRLYTHALRPSPLEGAPTRMGYVVRGSGCEAEHRDGETFIREGGRWVKLAPMQAGDAAALRERYYQENTSDAAVRYGEVPFSMNAGDYMRPLL